MSDPLVSIVIPVYNGGSYLREAIDSALAQTYPHCEILVINDGSNDNGATEAISLSYGERIRYFRKENGGVASALNLGIAQMRGDFLSWLSHDDVCLPHKCLEQVRLYQQLADENAIIYADADVIDSHGHRTKGTTAPKINASEAFCQIWGWSFLNGCTMLLPRKLLQKTGGFRSDLLTTQDYDLWLRLAESATFHYLPQVVLLSRQHDGQGSRTPLHRVECADLFASYVPQLLQHARISPKGFAAAASLLAQAILRRSVDYGSNCAKKLWTTTMLHTSPWERCLLFLHLLIHLPRACLRLLWLHLPPRLQQWVRTGFRVLKYRGITS